MEARIRKKVSSSLPSTLPFSASLEPAFSYLPAFPRFRHIRYVNKWGSFVKVKRRFTSWGSIYSYVYSKNYLDAYYSIGRFLNPHRIESSSKERRFQTLFLGMDLFFDIDIVESSFDKNIEKARNEAKRLLSIAKEKGWVLQYIAFSGAKGFHLSFKDVIKEYPALPEEREVYAKETYAEIVESISKHVAIDEKVTKDTRRIVRLPFTYNSKTGLLCRIISEEELNEPMKRLLKRLRENKKGNWSRFVKRARLAMSALRKVGRLSLGPVAFPGPQPVFMHAVSSTVETGRKAGKAKEEERVKKGQRHALAITALTRETSKKAKVELQKRAIPYVRLNLGNKRIFFSPLAFERAEMEKLAKIVGSPAYSQLRRYGHVALPLETLDKKLCVLEKAKKEELYIPAQPLHRPISEAHLSLFERLAGCPWPYKENKGILDVIKSKLILRLLKVD